MKLKLSVLDMSPVLEGVSPGEALRQSLLLAQTAERLGFTRYWVSEHHDMEKLASASPEVLLAYIGAHTNRIRIGSGAVLLPHYSPLKVAESFRLLAALFPGRIDLGVGRAPGGSAHATLALSGNFLERVWQMPASVKALSELLADEYRLDGELVTARPVPPAAPELWLLGTNEKSAKLAAELGAGFVFGQFMSDRRASEVCALYREQFQPGTAHCGPRTIVAVGAVCAESEAEAKTLAAAAMSRFASEGADSAAASGEEPPKKLLAGAPSYIRDELLRLSEQCGTDEFMLVTMTPRYKERLRSCELIAKALRSDG